MGIFQQFPYTNFHELNLDWFLKQFDSLLEEWATYHAQWDQWQGDVNQALEDFRAWFDNLDMQEEINNKLDDMAANGELAQALIPYLPFVTPEAFGAIGDGVADDKIAFTDAINTGKKILALNTYYISDAIELDNDASIKIDGFNTGIIKGGGDYLFDCAQFDTIEIYNTEFDGDNIVYGFCEWLTPADKVILNNCKFHNFNAVYDPGDLNLIKFPLNAAFAIADCHANIEGSEFYDNIGHGLIIRGFTKECFITKCVAHHNGCDDNHVRLAVSIGLGAYAEPHAGGECIISDCIAYYNGASGIAPHDIATQIITDCYSHDNWEHGIVIQECENGVISNCITENNDSFGIRVQGDFAQGTYYCENVKVSSNMINDNNGIWVGANCINVEVTDNNITAAARAFQTDSSTTQDRNASSENVIIHDNTVEESANYAGYNVLLKNPFKGLAKYNNRHKDGTYLANGFIINKDSKMEAYANYAPLFEDETDYNLITSVSPSLLNSSTLSGGTLTYGGSATGQAVEYKIPLNELYSKITALFVFDDYANIYPVARLRNSSNSEISFLDQKAAFYHDLNCLMIEIDLKDMTYDDGYLCPGIGFNYISGEPNALTNFKAYFAYGQKIKGNIII